MKIKNKVASTDLNYKKEEYLFEVSKTNNIEEVIQAPIGLDSFERGELSDKNGRNKINTKPFKHVIVLIKCLITPFALLLWAVSLTELILFATIEREHPVVLISGLVVLGMVFLAGLTEYFAKFDAHKREIKQRTIIENKYLILEGRVGDLTNLDFTELKERSEMIKQHKLTIGDVVLLTEGEVIPADCRILWSEHLRVDESLINGVQKLSRKTSQFSSEVEKITSLENILFAQTVIQRGSAIAVIVNVGSDNYVKHLVDKTSDHHDHSAAQKGVHTIINIIIILVLSVLPIFILLSVFISGWEPIDAIIFSFTIAVVLIPEALPSVIASNLKEGNKKLVDESIIVKDPETIQTMGTIDILGTDKTGTITSDDLKIIRVVDFNKKENDDLNMYLHLSASHQRNTNNPIDKAIIKMFSHLTKEEDQEGFALEETIEFSAESRFSGAVLTHGKEEIKLIKGSPYTILSSLKYVKNKNKIEKITDTHTKIIRAFLNDSENLKYTVLLVASVETKDHAIDDNDYVFEGYVIIENELRGSMQKVIKTFIDHEIDIKVLTSDSRHVTTHVAAQMGLESLNILDARDFNVEESHEAYNIYVKMTPQQKAAVITELSHHHNVAYIGDGIGDAAALKQATVGIAVNNSTSLAKKNSDVIMLENDLQVLENAFMIGRKTFHNAYKFVKVTLAANIGLLFTILLGSIIFNFKIVSSLQLLFQNLLFVGSNLAFVWDKVDDNVVKKPQRWSTKSALIFMFVTGLVVMIVSFINFAIMLYGFDMNTEIQKEVVALAADSHAATPTIGQFQTGFFFEMIFTHLVLMYVYRTSKVSIFKSTPSTKFVLTLAITAVAAFIVAIIFSAIDFEFTLMQGKNMWWYAVLVGLIFLGWLLAEGMKFAYIKISKTWLW
ncbi:HAD-IC family P-type ATPase [Spiroplasma endosymbiont of Othius punctulatus]|uniref:HAD-IC family P-type ATPase n=1 Tax=Spiroplasma endosymbiont of Othius punctulatus TaxID=3066289 RepID=UPI0030CEA622